ncbi:hypothetical protein L249_4707 [Ophiocordyceps polyrhachis-furcata BCC 54312]|uniref:Uncharacterized protein n=1 Tax=Ophiocordyceps polyrhachis-furcata BCC 54312 TaxID=1330021 RepID=A0A367L2W5_9HYPO|nr:hypothetical protein L249_4707 [Ophiocordyceps polyrhachis-furcata BCC 54312]
MVVAVEEEHEGASVKEILIEACRRNNTDLLTDALSGRSEDDISSLLNDTVTVMGNHLYHEAASQGNYLLLDQPNFECDPINRLQGDTPLHTAIRWLNDEPPAQRPFGRALVEMMLEAGSNPRVRNKGGLTPVQLIDPSNTELRELVLQTEFASQNAGDFVTVSHHDHHVGKNGSATAHDIDIPPQQHGVDDDEDADFSGSDEEDRAEWERLRKANISA